MAILWSLVRNCWYERTPLYQYQAIPYQQSHAMKPWNALSETELDALLVLVAKEIDDRLRSELVLPPAAVVQKPASEAETPASSPRAETDHAMKLLQGVEDLEVVKEIGDLFVLRRKWAGARATYDRLIESRHPTKRSRWPGDTRSSG